LGQLISGGLNFDSSVYAYTLHAAECMGRPDDWDFMRAVYESYNGLAQPYFRALSRSQLGRMQRGEVTGRNDSYDLDHFAYLEPGVVLVTNDRRMAVLVQHPLNSLNN
jgi:hypothetical protein